ncbi:TadG family pilus assembly protein [Solimonas sp. SE-A11]|uniref:TadG family pilus assembly protein n=1 Tax=Solimonas sp. SE-A11 TaxID=3054954 RepID=UPI00259D2809|nr:pilus assembly protein TadG-related protein [Solimonas sp. SE-A11]
MPRPSITALSPSARQQRGSIAIFAALGLSLAVILLSIADMGFLYFYKREYQKAADLAAMAGARSLHLSCNTARTTGSTNALQNLGNKRHNAPVIECGHWDGRRDQAFDPTAATEDLNAVRATISGVPPRFLPFIQSHTLTASAIAIANQPLAQLRIRSTLATVNPGQGTVLNAVVGGLLGGSLNLSAGAWDGLVHTDLNLLNYLDALAINLGLSAGDYDSVLNTQVSVGTLLGVAATALQQGGGSGGTANVNAALLGLQNLVGANLPGLQPLVRLGDLLNVQTGTPESGLDVGLNLFQLVQGSVQLANKNCVACANLPINLPGVAGANVRVRVIESPQLSAIGNPERARLAPLGADRIYVRTAQVRTLISVDLPASLGTTLNGLLNNSLVSALTNTVNDLLSLNLAQVLSCLLACDDTREIIDIQVLPTPRLDINIDAGGGRAYVNDYSCANEPDKSLSVPTTTAAAEIRIGKMGTTASDAATKVFSSSSAPSVEPVPILDIGTKTAHIKCTLLLLCTTTYQTATGTWTSNIALAKRNAFAGGGIGLKADLPVASTSTTQVYTQPPAGGLPKIGEAPAYKSVTSTNIVSSLRNTLLGLQLQFYRPTSSGLGNGLGNVVFLVGSVINGLVSAVMTVVNGLLGPLLDPLVNLLLEQLGVDLNKVEVGANLSCSGGGASLVD